MFKGACRLDDPAHRIIILAAPLSVNEIVLPRILDLFYAKVFYRRP